MRLAFGIVAWIGLGMMAIAVGMAAMNLAGQLVVPFLHWLFAGEWPLLAMKWFAVGAVIFVGAVIAYIGLEKTP